jgi:hypothetical protein
MVYYSSMCGLFSLFANIYRGNSIVIGFFVCDRHLVAAAVLFSYTITPPLKLHSASLANIIVDTTASPPRPLFSQVAQELGAIQNLVCCKPMQTRI